MMKMMMMMKEEKKVVSNEDNEQQAAEQEGNQEQEEQNEQAEHGDDEARFHCTLSLACSRFRIFLRQATVKASVMPVLRAEEQRYNVQGEPKYNVGNNKQ